MLDRLPTTYEPMAVSIQEIGTRQFRSRSVQNRLRTYRHQITSLCAEYRIHLERLEGMERNLEFVENRLAQLPESEAWFLKCLLRTYWLHSGLVAMILSV